MGSCPEMGCYRTDIPRRTMTHQNIVTGMKLSRDLMGSWWHSSMPDYWPGPMSIIGTMWSRGAWVRRRRDKEDIVLAQLATCHYNGIIMCAVASQITSLTIVYSVYSDTDQRKHQSSALLAFVWGIHRWPVNSPHKGPVMRKMFPFDDVILYDIWEDSV